MTTKHASEKEGILTNLLYPFGLFENSRKQNKSSWCKRGLRQKFEEIPATTKNLKQIRIIFHNFQKWSRKLDFCSSILSTRIIFWSHSIYNCRKWLQSQLKWVSNFNIIWQIDSFFVTVYILLNKLIRCETAMVNHHFSN